jgi:hypothetical protein
VQSSARRKIDEDDAQLRKSGAHPFDFAQGKLWSPYQHVTLTFDYLSGYSYQCGLAFALMTLELGLVLPLKAGSPRKSARWPLSDVSPCVSRMTE